MKSGTYFRGLAALVSIILLAGNDCIVVDSGSINDMC
jgi:hypothetical protein